MIISEYSTFYPISFGDLHPEIQPFKNESWKLSWSTFHHCKLCGCMDDCSRIGPVLSISRIYYRINGNKYFKFNLVCSTMYIYTRVLTSKMCTLSCVAILLRNWGKYLTKATKLNPNNQKREFLHAIVFFESQ